MSGTTKPVSLHQRALEVQPAAVWGTGYTQNFPLPIQILAWWQWDGTWQRSRWVWDAPLTRGLSWDAQGQTTDQDFSPKSLRFKRKHKFSWLRVKQGSFCSWRQQTKLTAPSARCCLHPVFHGALRQEPPRPCCAEPGSRRAQPPLGCDSFRTRLRVCCLVSSPPMQTPKAPGLLGAANPTPPHPTRIVPPGERLLAPRDGITSPPARRTCSLHVTKHLLSRDKGVARGKLRDAKVPQKSWFALTASVPWDVQGCC